MSLKYQVTIYKDNPNYCYVEYNRHGYEHNNDKPAIIWMDGVLEFWQYGEYISRLRKENSTHEDDITI